MIRRYSKRIGYDSRGVSDSKDPHALLVARTHRVDRKPLRNFKPALIAIRKYLRIYHSLFLYALLVFEGISPNQITQTVIYDYIKSKSCCWNAD